MAIHDASISGEQSPADRLWFYLDDDAWAEFTEILERSAICKPRLAALLADVGDRADEDRPGGSAEGGLAAAGQHRGEDKG